MVSGQYILASTPFVFKVMVCGHCLVTLSLSCDVVPHNRWNINMAVILPILMQNHSGGDSVVIGIVLPSPTSWDLGRHHFLSGNSSGSNKSSEQTNLVKLQPEVQIASTVMSLGKAGNTVKGLFNRNVS